MFKWLKNRLKDKNTGGETMARTEESEKKIKAKMKAKAKTEQPVAQPQGNVQVITDTQLVQNQLQHLIAAQEYTFKKMMEGFKQCGVTFEEE